MRITDVKDLIQILTHIRAGWRTNEIHRRTGSHKKVIKRLRVIADKNGWNNPDSSVPEEDFVNQAYRNSFGIKETPPHYLDSYKDEIKEWKEDGDTYVVISHKLTKLRNGKRVPESTLRDYCNRTFGKTIKVVNCRPNDEPGIAELDFGYLGITYDFQQLKNRKTWFISLRFRYSRHAIRKKLYCCDTINVLTSMVEIFVEFGGIPKRIVIDNFKVAIAKAHRYDPTETQAFRQFALHYGFIIEPCRPYTPKHKGGVESDVKYVKRNFWPLFRFDEKIIGHDVPHGDKIDNAFSKWDSEIAGVRSIKDAAGFSPHQLFIEERTVLSELPHVRFEPYNEGIVTVPNNYHICYDKAYYSVPWQYHGKSVLIKAYATRIQIFFNGELLAVHPRSYIKGKRTTEHTHRPKDMISYIEKTMPWLITKAKAIGDATFKLIEILANDKVRYRQGAMIGILNLAKQYSATRLEKACVRALKYGNCNFHAVKSILEKHKEKESEEDYSDQCGQTYFSFARSSDYYDFTGVSKTNNQKEHNNGYTYTITTDTH